MIIRARARRRTQFVHRADGVTRRPLRCQAAVENKTVGFQDLIEVAEKRAFKRSVPIQAHASLRRLELV